MISLCNSLWRNLIGDRLFIPRLENDKLIALSMSHKLALSWLQCGNQILLQSRWTCLYIYHYMAGPILNGDRQKERKRIDRDIEEVEIPKGIAPILDSIGCGTKLQTDAPGSWNRCHIMVCPVCPIVVLINTSNLFSVESAQNASAAKVYTNASSFP